MSHTPESPATPEDPAEQRPPALPRLPSSRACAALAAVMLGLGVAAGAAIGPTPESSLAGNTSALAQRLPLLLAALVGRSEAHAAATTTTPAPEAPAATIGRRKRRRVHRQAATTTTAASATAPSSSESASEEAASPKAPPSSGAKKLPAVRSVWLIQLAGGSFAGALANTSSAPYIDGQLLPAGTLLGGWSAVAGSAFANEAVLAEPAALGAPPSLLHSIVQPPCPEGAAGAGCAPETPGQLAVADEFLKTTLAQITGTSAYREHGLVVVTFATVGIAAQAGLPAGASSATLTSQPPGGVLLLSPFVRAGTRSSTTFDPTSPRQSLEALLH